MNNSQKMNYSYMPDMLSSFTSGGRLGLTGMSERARLLNGDFTLTSQPGKGMTVAVEVGY